MKKILIFDTSILCEWLEVPNKYTKNIKDSEWNHETIDEKIKEEEKRGTKFLLPVAVIIEIGNHIAQANENRYEIAKELTKLVVKASQAKSPWIALIEQFNFWESENLQDLVDRFPQFASGGISLGDATIIKATELYFKLGFEVEIFTTDQNLKSYERKQPEPPSKSSSRRDRGKKY